MAVLTGILLMAAACAARASNNLSVLDQVWTEARAHVHPASLVDSHFTNETRRELEQAAGSTTRVCSTGIAMENGWYGRCGTACLAIRPDCVAATW
jgi:hypothetical protein